MLLHSTAVGDEAVWEVWEGEAGCGCASSAGAAGVMVSKNLLSNVYGGNRGAYLAVHACLRI